MREVWKDIDGYLGLYRISNFGRVKSLSRWHRLSRGRGYFTKDKLMSISTWKGYRYINLSKKNVIKRVSIHRLVACAFILNPQNKPQVNHKDGKKSNNRVDNLEWATIRENAQHALDAGLSDIGKRGEEHPNVKYSRRLVLWVREMVTSGYNQRRIARKLGLDYRTINYFWKGPCWRYA